MLNSKIQKQTLVSGESPLSRPPSFRVVGIPRNQSSRLLTRKFNRLQVAAPEAPSFTVSQKAHGDAQTSLPWWQKPVKGAEHFQEITNVAELTRALSNPNGKMVAIDFFAGNCPSCRGAYPKLCSIAKDPELRERFNFYKANVQDPTLYWWIKRNNVTSIPYFLVYDAQGNQILSTIASFKHMPVIKEGMYTIKDNPQATKFGLSQDKTKIEVIR